ncbi:MAG TPA: helix-turn-helix transcriptional regulator [Streptosporangiaceae bacterium]
MAPQSSPTVKRRRLAAELRHYRDAAGLTIDDVAERLEWSTAKISRIENSRVSVLPRDVKFLLGVYGLTDRDPAWDVMLTLARESRERGWWHQYGDAVPDWFEVYVGLEADATSISAYHTEFVPGLIQTADYARAITRAKLSDVTDDDLERIVGVRMERQKILTSDDGPHVWFVINEAVVRRVVGGPEVMRGQLDHLIVAAELPRVQLQVLPFDAGAHASMDGSFSILAFREQTDPQVVYMEYLTGALYLEKPADTDRYRLVVDHLRATALNMDASRALIAGIAERLG